MACKQVLIGMIAAAVFAGCGGANKKVICSPVPSFASPAVSCVAVAEPKPEPPKPVVKEEPKPEPKPEPEPEPEPPKPVVVKKEAIELDRTVQFEPNSAKLIEDSKTLLDEVAKALEEHPEVKLVSIEGHTDSKLTTKHNQKLSVQRANSVRSYLIMKGVEKNRLVAKGFGETQPVADNSTWKGRFQNRRVDLKITKRDDEGGEETKAEKKPKAAPKEEPKEEKSDDEADDDAEAKPKGKGATKQARTVRKSKDKPKKDEDSE